MTKPSKTPTKSRTRSAARTSSSERKAHKDHFDRSAALALGTQIASAYPDFPTDAFVRDATKGLSELEFADRVRQFSSTLRTHLPQSIPEALDILTRSLPDPLPDTESVTDGWLQWPVGQWIADYGLDHFDASLNAMVELTQRFSSEFAVRPFVQHRADETFAALQGLTGHVSPHVRRWCSEGVRPRLPWGVKLVELVTDPSPIWPILEDLKDDSDLYVRRSVANNLNDIAKDHPDQVVKRCTVWSKDAGPERGWVIKHGLRTLVKAGHSGALEVLGFGPPEGLRVDFTARPHEVSVGGHIELEATFENETTRTQSLLVDFVVHYVRKNGSTNGKVFKWTTLELSPGQTQTLTKRHALRPTTVRALYPGEHRVEVQVNGVRLGEVSFELAMAD